MNITASPNHTLPLLALRAIACSMMFGAVVGAAEAVWLFFTNPDLTDTALLWWAPAVYSIMFAIIGIVAAAAYTVFAKHNPSRWLPEYLAPGLATAVTILTVIRWRLYIDSWDAIRVQKPLVDAALLIAALCLGVFASWVARRISLRAISAVSIAFIACAVVLSLLPGRDSQSQTPPPTVFSKGPNVIVITLDTLRADYLATYNEDAPTATPGIDAFVRDSTLFKQAIAQSSWTKPSFGSIYTGQRPGEHTATAAFTRLPDSARTLAEALHSAGYLTLGMSNCNPNNSMRMGFDQGFTVFEDLAPRGFDLGVPVSAKKLSFYRRVGKRIRDTLAPDHFAIEHYYHRADSITQTALDWIDTKTSDAGPFFLVVHYMDPHDPYMNGKRNGIGYTFRTVKTHEEQIAVRQKFVDAYIGDIEFMDLHLSALLEGLRSRGMYEDALIVITSDHGEEFLEHGDFAHGKTLYEEVIRVPLIIKLPGNVAAGQTNTSLARHIDIAPTILALTDSEKPESMAGVPLIDTNGEAGNTGVSHAISETDMEEVGLVSIRTMSEKLIRNADGNNQPDTAERYDLTTDPAEQDPISPTETDLSRILTEYLAGLPVLSPDTTEDAPPGVREQLEALGYLE